LSALRYHRAILFRFLVLALPLLLLVLGLFHFGSEAAGLPLPRISAPYLLGLWVLESLGLVAIYLLVRDRRLNRWLTGLAVAWAAWIFRGPVLALTIAGASSVSGGDWWKLALAWLGLYVVCGLLMAAVAGSLESS